LGLRVKGLGVRVEGLGFMFALLSPCSLISFSFRCVRHVAQYIRRAKTQGKVVCLDALCFFHFILLFLDPLLAHSPGGFRIVMIGLGMRIESFGLRVDGLRFGVWAQG